MSPTTKRIVIATSVLFVAGCAFNPHNIDIQKDSLRGVPSDDEAGYSFLDWISRQSSLPNPAVVVTMSGGGTRAATLGYAVLEELDKIPAPCADGTPKCTLLDNVIMVSGISGGAFTASNFALAGRSIFSSKFKTEFLQRDLLADLATIAVQPRYWFDRSEKLVSLLEEKTLLGDSKFSALRAPGHPFLLLSATDVSSGRSFPFVQDSLDDLCADLGKLEIARAATAAASFPYALNGVLLENYHATRNCDDDQRTPNVVTATHEIVTEMDATRFDMVSAARDRYRLWMRQATPIGWRNTPATDTDFQYTPLDRKIAYLHLFDGGLGDNLGIRNAVNYLSAIGTLGALFKKGVREILLVEVNARSDAADSYYQKTSPQTFLSLVQATAYGPVDRITELSSYVADEHLNTVMASLKKSPTDEERCEQETPCIVFMRFDADLLEGNQQDADARELFKRISAPSRIDPYRFGQIEGIATTLAGNYTCLRTSLPWPVAMSTCNVDNLVKAGCRVFIPGEPIPPFEIPSLTGIRWTH